MIICGRRLEVVKETAGEINALAKEAGKGGEVIAIQADVSSKKDIVEFYDKCVKVIDKVNRTSASWIRLNTLARLSGKQRWLCHPVARCFTLGRFLWSIMDDR